jgi:DNA polymerase III subunit epsilon
VRRALILDTETTGVDPSVDSVIEVAACLYDLEIGCAIESYASLVRAPGGNPAERINGVPAAALAEANHPIEVWRRVVELSLRADVVVAHNAEFDRSFVRAAGIASLAERTWCCTRADFLWEGGGEGGGRKLVEIVLAYGLGVASAHRALADVDMMSRLFTRVKELGTDLPALFRRAVRPKRRFVAMVSFEMKHLAKEAGFSWSPERREWHREMPPEDVEHLSFRVVERP